MKQQAPKTLPQKAETIENTRKTVDILIGAACQNVRNFLVFAEDSELFCIFQNQTLSTVAILPPFGSHPTQSRLKSSKETRNSTSKR